MSDRLAQLRSLADGVGDLQHGQPGDEDHCTAADVIRWAVAEIERNTRDQQPRTKEAAPMSEANERSVASNGSVAERPLGDPEIAVEILRLRVAELEEAIRRLAEQDATLSVVGGNVIVEMDATLTLTDAEREAIADAADRYAETAATLRGLLERLK